METEDTADGLSERSAEHAPPLPLWERTAARVVGLARIIAYLVLFRALLYLGPEDASDAMLLVASMGVVAIQFATVLAHELGHVVAGIFWGLTPVAMRVGPFEGRRRRRGWRVRWKRRSPGTPAGYAASLPTTGCDLRRAFRRLLLGGSAANLALALMACAIAPGLAHPEWREFVFAVATFNAVVGVSNLLPYRLASWPAGTDGYQFWQHRKGRSGTPDVLLTLAHLRICGRMFEGAMASSLPEADIALLESGASAGGCSRSRYACRSRSSRTIYRERGKSSRSPTRCSAVCRRMSRRRSSRTWRVSAAALRSAEPSPIAIPGRSPLQSWATTSTGMHRICVRASTVCALRLQEIVPGWKRT